MAECLPEPGLKPCVEKDDLVKLLQDLQNRKDVVENALTLWREKYGDVLNLEGEIEFSNDVLPTCNNSRDFKHNNVERETDEERDDTKGDQFLRITAIPAEAETKMDCLEEENTSWFFDHCLFTEFTKIDSDKNDADHYFEVSSLNSSDETDHDLSMQSLLKTLQHNDRHVSAKCQELQEVIVDISEAAAESCSLRERIDMMHRSLTLIEMRQEKGMRDALYENVASNCAIRRLHDEVIQLRIKNFQHQSDIQRLMAENNKLKLKLMERRTRLITKKANEVSMSKLSSKESEAALSDPIKATSSRSTAGLLEIDDLHEPVCMGAVQRGSLALYNNKINLHSVYTSNDITEDKSPATAERSACPLCNHLSDEEELDNWSEVTDTRSIGTSTADIENIVSLRTSIVVMGMVLPIPLFLACLLRTLEESMFMVGRLCFAELPPVNSSFLTFYDDVMESLNALCERIQDSVK